MEVWTLKAVRTQPYPVDITGGSDFFTTLTLTMLSAYRDPCVPAHIHIGPPTLPATPTFFLSAETWAFLNLSLCLPHVPVFQVHPYPTGSLGGTASQANRAVDRCQLLPQAFHLPLGSLCSLRKGRGERMRERERERAQRTLYILDLLQAGWALGSPVTEPQGGYKGRDTSLHLSW